MVVSMFELEFFNLNFSKSPLGGLPFVYFAVKSKSKKAIIYH